MTTLSLRPSQVVRHPWITYCYLYFGREDDFKGGGGFTIDYGNSPIDEDVTPTIKL